jgi:hypothetical protein
MANDNPFLLPVEEYKRDIDVKKGYIQQVAKYLSLQLKLPYENTLKYVLKKVAKGGMFAFKDPAMQQLIKKARGHRVEDETTFLGYIEEIRESGRIVSPSLVVYERPEVERSVTAEWLDDNIAARKKSKKAMFELKQIGELMKSALADYDQNARKIRINSVSGMRGFEGNPIFLATGHSSLTSMCRAAAGYGNATVERFMAGSKHYHTPEIAKANLTAITTIEQMSRVQLVIDEYNLVYPTSDDVVAMVERSTSLYWDIPHEMALIRQMAEGMTPLERATVCYSGDMYHLAKFNPDVVKNLMGEMIAINIEDMEDVDTDAILMTVDTTAIAYINALCANILKGSTHKLVKENNPAGWQVIGRTAQRFKEASAKYATLITNLFAPKHLPPTVAALKGIQRRVCLAADTDSSIFSTEYWVEWYTGSMKRGEVEDRIWYLATYMSCQCIAHSLAMLSANVGVERSQLFRLAMKNEYAFPVFALTNLAKHYFSFMSMREGNVYEENELEIKGVELRGSTAPKHILKAAEEMMENIATHVNEGRKMNAGKLLRFVADHEIETIQSIKRGEYKYLRSAQIKPDSNKMLHHELWQEVFAPKYGESVAPPYPCVKITSELSNKTKTQEWLAGMEDQELAKRMAAWMVKWNRKEITTFYLPTMVIKNGGLPIELQEAANVRKLAYQINSGFYRILESTGLHLVDRNNYRLIYDFLGLTA